MNTEQPRPEDICAHENCGKPYGNHHPRKHWCQFQEKGNRKEHYNPLQTFKPSPKQEETQDELWYEYFY